MLTDMEYGRRRVISPRRGQTSAGMTRREEPRPAGTSNDGDVERQLVDEIANCRRAITQADQKAGTLLGWVGVAVAVTVTVLAANGTGGMTTGGFVALIGGWMGAGLLAASVAQLIIAIRPRIRPSQFGWVRYALASNNDELLQSVRREAEDRAGRTHRLVEVLFDLARVAHRKHRQICTATDLLLAGMGLLVTSALVFAIST